MKKVDDIMEEVAEGEDQEEIIEEIGEFIEKVEKELKKGRITSEDAEILIGFANNIINGLDISGWKKLKHAYAAQILYNNIQGGVDVALLETLLGITESAAKSLPWEIAELLIGESVKFFLGPLHLIVDFINMAPSVGGRLTMENELQFTYDGDWLDNSVWDIYYKAPSGSEITIIATTLPAYDFSQIDPIVSDFATKISIWKVDPRGPAYYEIIDTIKVLKQEEAAMMNYDYILIPKKTIKLPDGKYQVAWGNSYQFVEFGNN